MNVAAQTVEGITVEGSGDVGKLSFPAMLALVVGSMIGGGIFSLPQKDLCSQRWFLQIHQQLEVV